MNFVKKGDIVSRNSYNNDLLFFIDKIRGSENGGKIAILKGLTIRIEADSPIEDLRKSSEIRINNDMKAINDVIDYREIGKKHFYGKILHLDGDRRYSEKTEKYYKKRGLNYTVKYIAEFRQPHIVNNLLKTVKPDILIITGHDGMIKKGRNFYDINNYRNSRYFIDTVKRARLYNSNKNDLVIFAGACQSYYEAIMSAGANFASSPARILIDFLDPLIVAEQIAITEKNKIVLMSDLEDKIRNGRKSIGGIGATGKRVQ